MKDKLISQHSTLSSSEPRAFFAKTNQRKTYQNTQRPLRTFFGVLGHTKHRCWKKHGYNPDKNSAPANNTRNFQNTKNTNSPSGYKRINQVETNLQYLSQDFGATSLSNKIPEKPPNFFVTAEQYDQLHKLQRQGKEEMKEKSATTP